MIMVCCCCNLVVFTCLYLVSFLCFFCFWIIIVIIYCWLFEMSFVTLMQYIHVATQKKKKKTKYQKTAEEDAIIHHRQQFVYKTRHRVSIHKGYIYDVGKWIDQMLDEMLRGRWVRNLMMAKTVANTRAQTRGGSHSLRICITMRWTTCRKYLHDGYLNKIVVEWRRSLSTLLSSSSSWWWWRNHIHWNKILLCCNGMMENYYYIMITMMPSMEIMTTLRDIQSQSLGDWCITINTIYDCKCYNDHHQ